tara:strand:- start:1143 stop:1514 length:372 start_codon:yes stop_codon:yes gene_type:complete
LVNSISKKGDLTMAEPMDMMGESPPMESQMQMTEDMKQQATQSLMTPDENIQAVLMTRLTQMSPEDLTALDSAVTPKVEAALMKLLPELGELINALSMQGEEMVDENMDESGMPKDMGALGNM